MGKLTDILYITLNVTSFSFSSQFGGKKKKKRVDQSEKLQSHNFLSSPFHHGHNGKSHFLFPFPFSLFNLSLFNLAKYSNSD